MLKRSVVKVVGPLAPYAAGWANELKSRGYTALSVEGHLRLVAHASRWLAAGGLEAEAFTQERIEEFSTDRKAAGYSSLHTVRAVNRFGSTSKHRACCYRHRPVNPRMPKSDSSIAIGATSFVNAPWWRRWWRYGCVQQRGSSPITPDWSTAGQK
jgi:hypothetical protein